jgi:alpha-galactosidase
MLANRSAEGLQVANPEKFPDGFAAVAEVIHGLGLKSGLYTAEAQLTCAKFAASCDHEYQDAAQWAAWQIDYVKDDGCGSCPNRTDDENYRIMFAAIIAAGRPMVLTVEGGPNVTACSALGGCGNAHRVGHDIQAKFMSALSEADISSGLWPLAHNATNSTNGGWFNDMDILEVGNGPDFLCGANAAALARCRVHFTMHAMLKSPLLLGNDIGKSDAATLSVLSNAEAISVNQDGLGIQARRVRVEMPVTTALSSLLPGGANAVYARCNSSRPTQAWTFTRTGQTDRSHLYIVPCNASDPWQRWAIDSPAGLRNAGANSCVDSRAGEDPAGVASCATGAPQQAWSWDAASGHILNGHQCLDVFFFTGPDVELGGCKAPGDNDANQAFDYESATGLIRSRVPSLPNKCLGVEASPLDYVLATTDASGASWMLGSDNLPVNAEPGLPANASRSQARWMLQCPSSASENTRGVTSCSLGNVRGGGLDPNSQVGGSGPWPHTLYTSSYPWHQSSLVTVDASAALGGSPVTILYANTHSLIDDDLLGNITVGGDFCLDLVTAGMLETWVAPLTGGRAAVALLNRSPGTDSLRVSGGDLGWPEGTKFAVRDVWAALDRGVFTTYVASVDASAVALLILTPQ